MTVSEGMLILGLKHKPLEVRVMRAVNKMHVVCTRVVNAAIAWKQMPNAAILRPHRSI